MYWVTVDPERSVAHPHVVVQDDVLNHSRIGSVVVCALTTNLQRAGEPGNVLLDVGEGGLPKRSVVVVSQIDAVAKERLGEKIGTLSAGRVDQVLAGLRFLQASFFARKTVQLRALSSASLPARHTAADTRGMAIEVGAEQVIRTWLHRLWTDRDPQVIDELFVPDGSATGLQPERVIGPAEFHAFFALLSAAIVETRVDIEHVMTHGPEVMVMGTLRGQHRASGRRVDIRIAAHARVHGGKIVDATNVVDFMALMQQIGELAPTALRDALSR